VSLAFDEWLPYQRWYAGRGRTIERVVPVLTTRLHEQLDHVLLGVEYADGGSERYQAFVCWDPVLADEFTVVATIGAVGGHTAYDALFDEPSTQYLLALISAGRSIDSARSLAGVGGRQRAGIRSAGGGGVLHFAPEPGATFPVDLSSRVVDAEQSNTSVLFDAAAILKVFRRVLPGINPDLELNRVLGRAGCPHVAKLLGSIEGTDEARRPVTLAMVSQYAANSADGWSMATASLRDLLAEADLRAGAGLHPDEVGGDLAAESHRLGEAVAVVHRMLAAELGEATAGPPTEEMAERLAAAARAVPELSGYVAAVREVFRAAGAQSVRIQRIHGDLHLGQVLRTPTSWLLIDFEGEPGQPIAHRRRPDSPLRDVAGMLRSYEYAAQQLLGPDESDGRLAYWAMEWAARNRDAFCEGYRDVAGFDPRASATILCAYELDKAVYEAAYEARHRPSWLPIPLRSIAHLVAAAQS
jgi:maltokinase